MTLDQAVHDGVSAQTGRTVHELIRALTTLRRTHEITEAQLAAHMAVAETTVWEWESGTDAPMTMALLAWADALGCTVHVVDEAGTISALTERHAGRPIDGREPYRPLARALRIARTRTDLSQQDIADKLDVSLATVNQWESATRTPRFSHLAAWADTVNCQLTLNAWNPAPPLRRITPRQQPAAPALEAWETSYVGGVSTRHHVTVPAVLPMARTLRDAAARILADHPRRDDARQVIGEFAALPILEHRCDCCPPAQVTLTVDHNEHRIRLEISYHLALTHPPAWTKPEIATYYAHSLTIIDACADRTGTSVRQTGTLLYADRDITWWAELDHARPQPTPPTPST